MVITYVRESEHARALSHVRLTVAVLIGLTLAILWLSGEVPFIGGTCCVTSDTGAAGPSGTNMALNAQVVQSPSQLPPWTGPTWATPSEHFVYYPPVAQSEAAAEVTTPAGETATTDAAGTEAPADRAIEEPAAEPAYTITEPNAEVRQSPSTLQAWTGPTWPAFEHSVTYPSASADLAMEIPSEEPEAMPAPGAATAAAPMAAPAEVSDESLAPLPSEPTYIVVSPNAEVAASASTLPPWSAPTRQVYEHFVYHPPATAPAEQEVSESLADMPAPSARIYFRTSSHELPSNAAAELAPIVDYLLQHGDVTAVVRGFHDPRGEKSANELLARNRAASVEAALEAAGLGNDRVVIEMPVDSTGSGNYAEARRAEVSVRKE